MPVPVKRNRAIVYTRVSLDPRSLGRSVTEQEAECRAWADREGWTVGKVITETGSASRYARKERTGWQQVADELATGDYDVLLTWEASRATRDLTAYAELRDLCAKHHVLWGYSGTVHDLSQRDARFRTGLDALLAEDESARTSERIQRGVRSRAAKGLPHGKLPYGYRREYDPQSGALLRQVPDEETAPIVREIVQRVVDGQPLRRITTDLTRRGIPIPRPARSDRARWNGPNGWIPMTAKRIATSPTYAAMRVHRGEVIGEAAWPALVTRAQWEKACAILTDPTRTTNQPGAPARWLLSGIARCGREGCGGPMRVMTNRGNDTYTCAACFRVGRKVAPVDEHVTDAVLTILTAYGATPAATETSATPELEEVRAELQGLRDRLDGFTDAAAEGEVSPAGLARIEARLQPKITAAERKVRRLATPKALDGLDLSDPIALWKGADIETKRRIVRATVDVVIQPAGRGHRTFNPDLVEVTPVWER